MHGKELLGYRYTGTDHHKAQGHVYIYYTYNLNLQSPVVTSLQFEEEDTDHNG